MGIRIILILIFLQVLVSSLQADESKFVRYKTTDGLSFSNVNHLAEDDEGNIYASTRQGLSIFNGTSFIIFNQRNTPGFSNKVSMVLPLEKGYVLMGTSDRGLFLYDKFKERVFPVKSSFNGVDINLTVTSLVKDAKGFLWVGTFKGELFCISLQELLANLKENKTIEWSKAAQLKGAIDALCPFKDMLFAGDESKGIYRVRRVGDEFITDRPIEVSGSSKTYALAIYKDNLWIGTQTGIYRSDSIGSLGYNTTYLLKEPWQLKDNIVRTLSLHNDVLWAGTEGNGLFKLGVDGAGGIEEHFVYSLHKRHGLNSNYILTTLIDSRQNLWLGTWFGGINVMDLTQPAYSFVYDAKNENDIFSNIIWRIEKGQDQLFWLGTQGNGVCKYLNKEGNFKAVFNQNITSVSALHYDSGNNRLYVGSWGNGVKAFNLYNRKPIAREEQKFRDLKDERIYALTPDNKGGLWIGSFQKGLYRYNGNTNEIQKIPLPDEDANPIDIRCILYDSTNTTVWVGSLQQGLFKLQLTPLGEVQHIDHYPNFESADDAISIESLYMDKSRNLWMMLRNGLAVIAPGSDLPQSLPYLQGLVTTGMVEDSTGNIWVSTYKGIHKFKEDMGAPVSILSEYVFYDIAFDRDQNQLLAASDNGLLRIKPDWDAKGGKGIPIMLSQLKVFDQLILPGQPLRGTTILNKKLNYSDTIVLPHFSHTFSIGLNALSFIEPNKNTIHYRLVGFENIWNHIKGASATATYTNVPAGTYTLKVRASGEDSGDSGERRVLTIIKLKPWWASNLALVFYTLLLVFIIYLVYKVLKSRIILKQELNFEKQRLEREHDLHQQKLQFFTNISHDVRTPLTLMIGPLEEMQTSDELPVKFKGKVFRMLKNARMLHHLVDQVLDFRKMETDNLSLNLFQIKLNVFIRYIHLQFKDMALSKNIDFEISCPDEEIILVSDPKKLESILFNLLSNAIKFTRPYGQIFLEIDADESQIYLNVRDTGIGIPESELNNVFVRFYRSRHENVTQGTGIGLTLVKKYVELLGGHITVKSKAGKGTGFFIVWPVRPDAEAFDKYEPLQEQELSAETEADQIKHDSAGGTKKETIVAIDDNTDILEHLTEILQPYYKVFTATNGKDGLNVVQRKNPDLVICDIMMEGMDGIEVTEKIKTNLATSHIPVILLTAKNTVDAKIEGYEKGADSYIEKPFNSQLLITRIKSLIERRRLLKRKFMVLDAPADKVAPTSVDESFLKQVIATIEDNLTDSDFSVQGLVEAMQISQDQLYRKIKAITGLSINHFIRSIRLKKAAQLLREKRMNVSEVMFQVGFNNSSYFTRCFKTEFGATPSEFVNK
ncbi:hybrid sensor histidine kinase/response regulator transcription factor [Saccharicrinis carchari]|nr:hybrid sensor histidine kinase/response regulator transcription factor [Saccharicrinis carchari]